MAYEPELINYTLQNPDTVWEIWEKVNVNFLGLYQDAANYEQTTADLSLVDGGSL